MYHVAHINWIVKAKRMNPRTWELLNSLWNIISRVSVCKTFKIMVVDFLRIPLESSTPSVHLQFWINIWLLVLYVCSIGEIAQKVELYHLFKPHEWIWSYQVPYNTYLHIRSTSTHSLHRPSKNLFKQLTVATNESMRATLQLMEVSHTRRQEDVLQ